MRTGYEAHRTTTRRRSTMSGFQFFEGTTESAAAARITVRKGGILVLTRAAVEMLGDDVAAVQVGYNPETRDASSTMSSRTPEKPRTVSCLPGNETMREPFSSSRRSADCVVDDTGPPMPR